MQLISNTAMFNWIFVHLKRLLLMKTKEKDFDTVKHFRKIKEKISEETSGMDYKQYKEYLNRRKLKPTSIE
ncbi:MAG: hypothetical protein WBA23_12490 [Tunicatimonas sp.]|uniref:hypothetical protein n=1 Tax=Tunicatimonas sp. TaxID=1940096 RepID=UPI003C79387D